MEDYLKQLPAWAQDFSQRYLSGGSSLFLIHGNVNDWVPWKNKDSVRFLPIADFLKEGIFGKRDTVIQYDQGSGITINKDAVQGFYSAVEASDLVAGTTFSKKLPKSPADALAVLDRYIRTRLMDAEHKGSVAIIINFAHMVAPRGELQFMNQDDFRTVITLLKWANDPQFIKSDVTICLVTANLQDLNESIVTNPFTSKIEVTLPNETERLEFIKANSSGIKYEGMTEELFSKQTNALSRVDIEIILREAQRLGQLDLSFVSKKKKELIEKACFGLLEFLEPKLTLNDVQGHEPVKKRLREDIELIKKGYWDALPIGYLICGPVGTGKTYIATCTIGDIGIPCVQLLNFRSKWVGATEGNLERILMTLRAMGPVGVIIDEADAFMGDRSSDGDSGTSNRIFAQFASQMGDTKYRGKILWFLLTCRPDLLPVDIKRQGRIEVHIPLFYPDNEEEKKQLFLTMAKKTKWPITEKDVNSKWFEKKKLSGADIESIMVNAKRKSLLDNNAKEKALYLEEAAMDFIPATSSSAVKFQELAAVIECTHRSFLPEMYQKADRAELLQEFNRAKVLLGEN